MVCTGFDHSIIVPVIENIVAAGLIELQCQADAWVLVAPCIHNQVAAAV